VKLSRKKEGRVPFSLIAVIIAFLSIVTGIYAVIVANQHLENIVLKEAEHRLGTYLLLHEELLSQTGVSAVLSAVNKTNDIVYGNQNPVTEVENISREYMRNYTGISAGGKPIRLPEYSATHKNLQWNLSAFKYNYEMMNETGVIHEIAGSVYIKINGKVTTTLIEDRSGYSVTTDINLDSWVPVTLPFIYQQKLILKEDINGTLDYLGFAGNITLYVLKRTYEEIFDYDFTNITKQLVREAVECGIAFDEARLYQKTANTSLHNYLLGLGDRSEVDPFEYWKDIHGWSKKTHIRATEPIHLNYSLYNLPFYFYTKTVEFKMNNTERTYGVHHEILLPDSCIILNETTKEVLVKGGVMNFRAWEAQSAIFVQHKCTIELTYQPLLLMG